ncbi:unnamed protein product [Mytilus edulis]|uniref:Uncharacterized protein n=1 Tax=Mytilus edulis TaxID=6550 RepID=A0A8S3RTD2_MYTED|nr:unnamed protein product [Mytilus edulis]
MNNVMGRHEPRNDWVIAAAPDRSVSNNNLTMLPGDVFRKNVMLKTLELSNNKLSSIPDAVFSDNAKLQSLSLANNYLTSIPKDVFKNNVALVYVSLSNNNLTSVPDAVFMNNKALTYLPNKDQFLTHIELCKIIDANVCLGSHIKGLQRVKGMWRIYLDNDSERESMVTSGLVIRDKLVNVYTRNPRIIIHENPNHLKVRIKNVPCSADD